MRSFPCRFAGDSDEIDFSSAEDADELADVSTDAGSAGEGSHDDAEVCSGPCCTASLFYAALKALSHVGVGAASGFVANGTASSVVVERALKLFQHVCFNERL